MSFWSVGLWWNNVTNNTAQPGRLQLERAAAGASARAEHSTIAGALLRFGVCCELAVFQPQLLPGCRKCRWLGMFSRPF